MTIARRSFLAGILGAAAAPAIVKAESLMKLWVPPQPKGGLVLRPYQEEIMLSLTSRLGKGEVWVSANPAGPDHWADAMRYADAAFIADARNKLLRAMLDRMPIARPLHLQPPAGPTLAFRRPLRPLTRKA